MSVLAYTGLPGSGKSYAVVEHQILPALKAGRRVVTNIPLNLDAIRQILPDAEVVEFPTEQIKGEPDRIFDYVTPGCVFILDEVWRLFPSGLRSNKVPEPFKSLLAEHRHMVDAAGNSTQIVLVTQDLAQISAFARQLVETTFRSVKMTVIGADRRFRVDVFQGPVSGPNPPLQSRIREVYGTYKPEVYKLYKSHTMSESAEAGANEKSVDQRANVWRKPSIILGFVAAPLMVFFGVKFAYEEFKGSTAAADPEPATVAEIAPWRREGPPVGIASPGTSEAVWRVAGYIGPSADLEGGRAVLTSQGGSVIIPFKGNCRFEAFESVLCRWQGQDVREVWPNETTAPPVPSGAARPPSSG